MSYLSKYTFSWAHVLSLLKYGGYKADQRIYDTEAMRAQELQNKNYNIIISIHEDFNLKL